MSGVRAAAYAVSVPWRDGQWFAVYCCAAGGSLVLEADLALLTSHRVFHGASVPVLALLFLPICPLIARYTWHSSGVRTDRASVPVISVVVVLLAQLGVLGRVALGNTDVREIGSQQFGVLGAVVLAVGSAVLAGSWREVSPRRRTPLLCAASGILALLCLIARPGPGALPQGAAYPRDWPEPLADLLLIGLVAWAQNRGWVRRRLEQGRTPAARVLDVVLRVVGPAVGLLFFAFTRDPACVALMAGAVMAWSASQRRRTAARIPLGQWIEVLVFCIAGFLAVAVEGLAGNVPGFSPRTVFSDSDVRALSAARLARSWVGPVSEPTAVQPLVPANPLDAGLMGFGLAVLFFVLIRLTSQSARRITDVTDTAVCMGLVGFLAAQCLGWMLTALRLPGFGLQAPLLAGSVSWDAADALAIGIVAGLTLRPTWAERGGGVSRWISAPHRTSGFETRI